MPVDINGYAASVLTSRVVGVPGNQPNPVRVENDRPENQRRPTDQINPEVIERKVAARAESSSTNLQRYRDPDELPKKTQSALQSYQDNARTPYQDDELVGVDIFV